MSLQPAFIKEYADHATQTTFSPPSSPLLSKTPNESGVPGADSQLEPSIAEDEMLHETYLTDAYSDSFASFSSSPARSITTARRTLKPQQLPLQVPSQKCQIDTQRTASLPETISLYSAKSQLNSRIVSMPEHLKSLKQPKGFMIYSSDYNDISTGSIDSLGFGADDPLHAAISPRLADIPHTPSPPSSPESVVIIENKYQLSDTFLRNNHVIQDHKDTDREGWVTWAKSPPRPIPALHGPLSLPYARCPSGAEGTVIEEQDNLPRMIWGLGADHQGGIDDTPQTTPHREPVFLPNIPPRLQKQESMVRHIVIPSRTTKASIEQEISQTKLDAVPVDQDFKYPAQFNQTIDLSRLLAQTHLQDSSNLPQSASRRITNRAQTSRIHDETLLYSNSDDQQHELQFVQRRLHDDTPFPSSQGQTVSVKSKPLVSTQPAAGSSRPVILLESQPNSVSLPPPRRISAIEIAQKFRQQQSLLSTPPSSSSPQWSSNFSPYQDSILSPEAIFLSSLSPDIQHDIAQQLRRSVYEHVANSINDACLAPTAHIEQNVVIQAMGSYGKNTPRNTRPSHSYTQVGSIPTSPRSDGAHPRPPPNTPLPPIPSRNSDSSLKRLHSKAADATPPSPASPSESLSHHHRSIPLSRLVQRRLSAVIEASEEPSAAALGSARPPSPPQFQQNFHMSCAAPTNVCILPSFRERSPNRRLMHNQHHAKITGQDHGRVSGYVEGALPPFDQMKTQNYGRNLIEVRENNHHLPKTKNRSIDPRDAAVNREHVDESKNPVHKEQAPLTRRKLRGKKKHASAGSNMTIAT